MKRYISLLFAVSFITLSFAQDNFPRNGTRDERPSTYAFTNATIFQDYQTRLENATLIIQDGKVLSVGTNLSMPAGAIITDLDGKWVYPALVDPYTSYGLPEVKRRSGFGGTPQYDSKKEGAYGWNESVKSDYTASAEFKVDDKAAKKLRDQGFGSVLTFRADGVIRGSGAFVSTGNEEDHLMVINPGVSSHLSFNKGTSRQLYPTSIMGMVALIRQTYYDAQWYKNGGNEEQTNQTLESFNKLQSLPQIFEANSDKIRVLLADKVGDEFGTQYIIKGNGDEYQRINEIKATGASLIIPLNFPKVYDVDDPIDALEISMTDLKHWELAPTNPGRLANAGINIALTAHGLKDIKDYWKNVKKAVEYGMSETQALKAMTYTPASLVDMQNEVGSLQPGRRANFIIASGNLFDDGKIFETWVHGTGYEVAEKDPMDLAGKYHFQAGDDTHVLEISGEAGKHKAKIVVNDTTSIDVKLKVDDQSLSMNFSHKDSEGSMRLTGWTDGRNLKGTGLNERSEWISWTATFTEDIEKKDEKKDQEDATVEVGDMIYPFVPYGWKEQPKQETILFRNATVWTMEGDGKLENADVLVQNGKIAQVGQNLSVSGARIVDATGKHVTPGIIDEHSHAALSGVNESSHAITGEVRQYDAVDSEDVNIYRQLAGGVVAAQLLHGSANPVGGQSALIKFRWGSTPEGLRIQGADEYIKFALGENVKQSNRSPQWNTRFPQTRMGVEQVFVDGFTRARVYDQEWKAYNGLSAKVKARTTPPRRDLQLEALAEILNSERFISCHSYVQSEINMLMKVAEQFDFRVNTFTHILEGYKVADKMAAHGVGGSTFSDWWAYKYEVREAIPYNAALMTQAGVVVAINSDSQEMARRLNQEAGKSIKYGGMDEVEALKMVTINPAKLLHLDDRMGSLKAGKDGDVVLWDDHPLSIYAKPEMTLVDGIVYFDAPKDAEMRDWIRAERTRLINKMKNAKKNGAKIQKVMRKERHNWHCDDIVEELGTVNE